MWQQVLRACSWDWPGSWEDGGSGGGSQQVGSCELRPWPRSHLALLLSLPRATEEAEKAAATYLDSGTHPAQGEAPAWPAPPLCLLPRPLGLPDRLCLSVSPTRPGAARFRLSSVSLKPTRRCSQARAERVSVCAAERVPTPPRPGPPAALCVAGPTWGPPSLGSPRRPRLQGGGPRGPGCRDGGLPVHQLHGPSCVLQRGSPVRAEPESAGQGPPVSGACTGGSLLRAEPCAPTLGSWGGWAALCRVPILALLVPRTDRVANRPEMQQSVSLGIQPCRGVAGW